jgi:hypothetical protein
MTEARSEHTRESDRKNGPTLFDLVAAVQDSAASEAEVMATLRHMVESGQAQFGEVSSEAIPWAA